MSPVIYRLTNLLRRLDDEIRRELRRHVPDSIRLLRLKLLRLTARARLRRLMPLMLGA